MFTVRFNFLQEGIKFLEKNNPDLAEECKNVQESVKNGAGDAPEVVKNGSSPAKLPRDNTMVTTAQVCFFSIGVGDS